MSYTGSSLAVKNRFVFTHATQTSDVVTAFGSLVDNLTKMETTLLKTSVHFRRRRSKRSLDCSHLQIVSPNISNKLSAPEEKMQQQSSELLQSRSILKMEWADQLQKISKVSKLVATVERNLTESSAIWRATRIGTRTDPLHNVHSRSH